MVLESADLTVIIAGISKIIVLSWLSSAQRISVKQTYKAILSLVFSNF